MSFGGATASEQTVILKSTSLYTGIRIQFQVVTTSTGAIHGTNTLSVIDALTIDVPEYGSRSRRVDVDSNTKFLLPAMAQLGAITQDHAETATNVNPATGADSVTGYSYFDFPTVKTSLNEDTRITITADGGHADRTLQVHFYFLDKPFRNVYFNASNHAAGTDSIREFFPSDGVLQGIYTGTTDGSLAVSSIYEARDPANISRISYNGEQETTFTNPEGLGAGMDEQVGSDTTYADIDTFAMLANFPASAGQNYVEITRATSKGHLVLGVMSDA